ncbi:MAG: S-ribosylhomocysteine lyase [Prevotella sp.]|nr:S-ribosylhomocysteine lyase [Prevotella sp.]
MEKIDSFKVDHKKLPRGLFVSRVDDFNGFVVTTYDLRICRPYVEPTMSAAAIHTIEHLGATFLRTLSSLAGSVVYFGPMGCQTGFYLVLCGHVARQNVLSVLRDMFLFISRFDGEIPGATERECGNCHLNDLAEARKVAWKYYLDLLSVPEDSILKYPE